ncbi:TPA: molybdopterin-dependent oxidoreductase [Escherichia coli]|uniref:DMSO/selenate family reductase complex A subunit n=1 Tax=Escherichia coli TaxID=562 RepID=UPI0019BDE08B|nr:DMSO/selenate family reductase complex A subunit [Escherichia coli]HAM3940417.1 molybdopterin-dependent oxidoreductase [Escherichia coli]
MKIHNTEALMSAEISRRSLMKTSALGSLALASSAFTLPFSQMVRAAQAPVEEKAVWSSCTVNCGSRCLLRLHVKDDTVYWVESDTTGDDVYGNHQVRACLRGRSIRRRMNHPDRLKYPMKRVGKRGEGKFERISWDEALDTISDNLRRILKDYGNEAVHVLYGTGVDGALACAIAWVLITENMVDQPFLDKYCVGYDEKTLPANAPRNAHYKAYILGEGPDGIAKTPEWAAKITSIPAEKIIQLAREIGSAKPAYICQGWGPQRHSNGEQTSRAIAMLSVLTGNVGINGGNSGVREGSWDLGVEWFPMLENPVKTQISVFTWTDAIDHGTEMTAPRDGVRGKEKLDVPIKFLWCYASNTLINQHGDINHTHEVLQDDSKCEMIVGIDHFMTASAKYCDILLPDLMPTEQEDLISHESAGNMGYVILAQPATSAKFERKPIYWMLSEVAKRLGPDVYQTFTEGRSQHEWIKYLHAKTKERNPEMPDYEEMKTTGIFKKKCPEEHYVAFRAFRVDPQANPLKTPSGKIEIYSERLAKIADTWELKKDEIIHPLPAYTPGFDGWDDPLRKTYPLQLTGFHYKARTHSSYGNIDVLQQACPQEVWINPIDAQARGIRHGDTVRVFNNNGEMLIAAKVTPRILPGVTAIGQGAWLKADMFGDRVDHGGSINILTSHRPSPLAKGNPSHSNLVQIEKV